jgi:aminopeptidase C
MGFRKIIFIVLATLTVASCGRPEPKKQHKTGPFVNEVCLRYTPVKNQGRSPLCWAYAMLATIETEHIMMGDSINLSPHYAARCMLSEEARRCYLDGSHATAASLRATVPALLRLLRNYGALPYDTYNAPDMNGNTLTRRITLAATQSHSLDEVDKRTERLLDHHIGYLPKRVYMFGAEYTFKEFAHSVCMKDEYVALTSFTHHPFGETFALEVPDNRSGELFYNVPIDQLMHIISHSLRAGHPVCWEGDISEAGFSFSRGVATLDAQTPCTQEQRQREFSRRRTTDDHCMELIGIAHDHKGRTYFIAKNSWGTANPYGGLMYLSADYVRMKTIAVVVKNETRW